MSDFRTPALGEGAAGDAPDHISSNYLSIENGQDTAAGTNGSPSTSAVHAVFCTAELLEEILLHVASITALGGGFVIGPHHLPALRLFVIQRVNKTFQATIAGSPDIQKAMYLKPSRVLEWRSDRYFMANWLLKQITISDGVFELRGRATGLQIKHKSEYEKSSDPEGLLIADYPHVEPAFDGPGPDESWRKIKLHCVEKSNLIDFSFIWPNSSALQRRHSIVLGSFHSNQEMTLGKVHDGLQRLLRFMIEHDYWQYGEIAAQERWEPKVRDSFLSGLKKECARDDLWV